VVIEMEDEVINPTLTKKFIYVVVGIHDYRSGSDTSIMAILSRLRAESKLTETNWNLFGFRRSPSVDYYEQNLEDEEYDIIFVAQKDRSKKDPTDEDEWRTLSLSAKTLEDVFPINPTGATKEDDHSFTWYLSPTEKSRKHWIKEVPRFFQISHHQGEIYRGLVLKNLQPYLYGEKWFDGSQCKYYTRKTLFKRTQARSLHIYEMLEKPHSNPEKIPVIATAKLVKPYVVDLVHPKTLKKPRM
jgi:hypothetical protein